MARTKPSAGDLVIDYVDPATLKAYANNARTHSAEQVAQIRRSIDEFGFTNPVLVDEQGIIAGHGRVLAALLAPKIKRIPSITLVGLTPEKRRALILADNKLALNAGWDADLLRAELMDLQGAGLDLSLTGFAAMELADIFATRSGRIDPDQAPPVEKAAVSIAGDVWALGGGRLMCGDSTDQGAVAKLLNGDVPALMVTDPPYGVNYDPEWRNQAARTSKGMGNRALGAGAVGKVQNDDRADWSKTWALFPGNVAYVWHAGIHGAAVQVSLESAGLVLRQQIIWVKTRFAISRGDYHWKHEPCLYMVRKGAKSNWQGSRKQDTVWRIEGLPEADTKVVARMLDQAGLEATVWEIPFTRDGAETGHSTQKPVECMRRPMLNNSQPGDLVYEPFCGSGTTIIAGEMTGRSVLAMEIDPLYVDMAVRRWQLFTGKTAVLLGANKSFNAIATERGVAQAA